MRSVEVLYAFDEAPRIIEQEEQAMDSTILVISVGNEYRGDDGVGPAVLRLLKEAELPQTSFKESIDDAMVLLEAWAAATNVILIDAVASGAAPGTIYRLDPLMQPLPTGVVFSSTHVLSVAEAIELARALHQLPSRLIVYGIEGRNFAAGVGLTQEVEQAVRRVADQVKRDIQDILA